MNEELVIEIIESFKKEGYNMDEIIGEFASLVIKCFEEEE